MKNISSAYAAHILQPVTTLAICWRLTKRNGDVVLGTNHDRDIPVTVTSIGVDIPTGSDFTLNGVYKASTGITASSIKGSDDMSVDNMEVDGPLQEQAPNTFVNVSVDDIKAGLYDGARVTVFLVNWQNPDDFQDVLRHGFFGQIDWNSDGYYRTEIRGLHQILQQQIGRTCGETCDVEEFGDARCKRSLVDLTVTGTVLSVTSNRQFTTDVDVGTSAGIYNLGRLTWTSGDNVGFVGQVKNDSSDSSGSLLMYEEFPNDVEAGDTFTLVQGCNRQASRCKELDNFVNFRGPGIFNPGMDELIRAP